MSQYILNIKASVAETISQHLESTWPDEGCGFFFGKEGKPREVTEVYPVSNVKAGDKRRRFEISGLDYIKAERYALEHDLELLGIFHSHPNHPAVPSEHDLRQAVPFFSYIIVSVYDRTTTAFTSWRLDEAAGVFEEEEVRKITLVSTPLNQLFTDF